MNSFSSQVRAVAIALIFRRAVRLAGPVALSTSNGETVNLIASDAQKYYDLFPQINLIWTAPIQVIHIKFSIRTNLQLKKINFSHAVDFSHTKNIYIIYNGFLSFMKQPFVDLSNTCASRLGRWPSRVCRDAGPSCVDTAYDGNCESSSAIA